MNSANRNHVIDEINQILQDHSFETSNIYERSCFDMIARKNLLLLLMKVLINIDSVNPHNANEIKQVSNTFYASPLIVGLKSKTEYLEEDVVYERHGIPVIGVETLKNMIIYDDYPEVIADRGGYYVKINGPLLNNVREEYGLSLKDLAYLSHVSRETIYKYEKGLVRASPETAMLLEKVLNTKITLDIDVFQAPKYTELDLKGINNSKETNPSQAKRLSKLGYDVLSTKRTPFDALAKLEESEKLDFYKKGDNPLIANLESNRKPKTLKNMAVSLKDISVITESEPFFIVDNKKMKEEINGIPIIKNWELKEMEYPSELIKLLKERKS